MCCDASNAVFVERLRQVYVEHCNVDGKRIKLDGERTKMEW